VIVMALSKTILGRMIALDDFTSMTEGVSKHRCALR
jgi:hypothetical protein